MKIDIKIISINMIKIKKKIKKRFREKLTLQILKR